MMQIVEFFCFLFASESIAMGKGSSNGIEVSLNVSASIYEIPLSSRMCLLIEAL